MIGEQKLKKFALTMGADLVGITSVDRLNGAPKGFRPEDSLSRAKSVISLAKQYPKGLMGTKRTTAYFHFMKQEFALLETIALKIALYIESYMGGKAAPIPADIPYEYWDEERKYGRADLSHKHVAQAAGLGVIGRNTLLITPEYGNRIHLTSIITDVDLEPDEACNDVLLRCSESCSICIEACPVNAIREGYVDQKACRTHCFHYHPRGWHYYACWECREKCILVGKQHQSMRQHH